MKVIAPKDLHVVPLGRKVERGEVVTVDDDLGAQLVAQGWTEPWEMPRKRPAKRSAKKRATQPRPSADVTEPDQGDEPAKPEEDSTDA